MYEVVINGELARTADRIGFRGFSKGPDGKIIEHARLFEEGKLQNIINATAIWQLASVIVAQKHLADISAKLDEIKNSLRDILQFLDNERKAKVDSAIDYLRQAYQAFQCGEFSPAVRNQLESCDKELSEIFHHLIREYEGKINTKVKKTKVGTKQISQEIGKKIEDLDKLNQEIMRCLEVRILGLHILSLFPDEPQLKVARYSRIENSIDEWRAFKNNYKNSLTEEINNIDSFWNTQETLDERKKELNFNLQSSYENFQKCIDNTSEVLQKSEQLLLEYDRPIHLLLQYENGKLLNMRRISQKGIENMPSSLDNKSSFLIFPA